MKATPQPVEGVILLEPEVFFDRRGFFFESFNAREFAKVVGFEVSFVQDNHSSSVKGALRGLHFQRNRPQAKLVRALRGEIFDVAVDLRPQSATYRRWIGVCLSAENRRQLWIPTGCAHGFLAMSDVAEVQYKVSDFWQPDDEYRLRYDDPEIGVAWPRVEGGYVLSDKDVAAPGWAELVRAGAIADSPDSRSGPG